MTYLILDLVNMVIITTSFLILIRQKRKETKLCRELLRELERHYHD